MPEQVLIDNCAPTLAGIKTGNLVSIACPDRETYLRDVQEMNGFFGRKGLRAVPIGYTRSRALLYFYRPSLLERDLQTKKAREILSGLGYPADAEACVEMLSRRLRDGEDFPHEIGLFLGYPPADVEMFMNHRDAKPLCVGVWKEYFDEQGARRAFGRFAKCERIYRQLWNRGRNIDQLTVRLK